MGLQKQAQQRWKDNQNKARLVCKGCVHIEGIECEETFLHVIGMEAVKIILACACSKRIKLYRMNVKSGFLNGE